MKRVREDQMQPSGVSFWISHPEEGRIVVCIDGKHVRVLWQHGYVHIRHPRAYEASAKTAARIVNDLLRDRADALAKAEFAS